MELGFRNEDLDFRAEVQGFIDRHWLEHVRGPRGGTAEHRCERKPEEQAWFDALVSRGWSVPSWPVEYGGRGWTPTQKFIWDRQTARAETPQMNVFGVSMLGPVLCRWGSPAQQARFLPPIREARVQWCHGCSEPQTHSDPARLATTASRQADHYVVNGEMTWTSGAHVADWMFCLARTRSVGGPGEGMSFLLIDMQSPGIQIHPVATPGGQHRVSSVTLNDVQVPVEHRVGEENEGWTYAKALLNHERIGAAWVATCEVQLRRLRQMAVETPCDGGSVAEDEDFQRKYRALEVDLLSLEMLELRILASVEPGRGAEPEPSMLKALLEIRGAEIGQRIAELMVETLGYYALPYPDELLIDNEGAVGHEYASSAIRGWLFARAWGFSFDSIGGDSIGGDSNAGSIEEQKNIIARSVLGL